MDNLDCWNGVNKEIIRGIKLRDEKNKFCSIPKKYDIVDIDLNEPSCSKTAPWQNLTCCRRKNVIRTFSFNYSNIRQNTNVKKKRKTVSTNKTFRRAKNRCPLRVAELSVPTKRHCLETWRNNKDILPSFMVDRLRQIVMDEKPIVKIYDAIDCFKREMKSNSRSPAKIRVKNKHKERIRLFCALLSYKIIQKLQRPLNLTLNSELKTLSRVIDFEITNILNNSNKPKQNTYKIQKEIADKITMWVANVLEESSYKLLLEEFEELKEEEGPVWDLIDELVDNVVAMCKPENINSSSATESTVSSFLKHDINKELSLNEASIDKFNKSIPNKSNIQKLHKNDSILSQILNNIFDKEALSLHESNSNKNDYSTVVNSVNESVNNSQDIENSKEYILEDNDYTDENNESFDKKISLTEIHSPINNLEKNDDISTYIDHDDGVEHLNANLNEIDVEGDVSKHMDTNKEIQKDVDINSVNKNTENNGNQIEVQNEDTPDDSINIRKKSINNDSDNHEDYDNRLTKFSKNKSIKSELLFAPPNEHLLSDADESWPENLRFPVLKATVSVSKSVLSLGKIFENEEKQFESLEKDINSNYDGNTLNTTSLFSNDINNDIEKVKYVEIHEPEKISSNTNRSINHHDNDVAVFTDIKHSEKLPKTEITQMPKTTVNMTLKHMPVINIKTTKKFNTRKNTHEEAVQTKDDWKKRQTFPPEDILTNLKYWKESKNSTKLLCSGTNFIEECNMKDIDVQKWCKGLENVMQNIELWTEWVEKTCIKKHLNKKDSTYMWMKLKNNVDFDSKFWQKVSKKLKSGLSNYRTYYVISKVSLIL
ncbi:unnamed protein product [Euphydryas editha]|uniref:Uncharacterized protein n=1 Tax=Euphydryas editha TaxID=104508 RepID=A0AAU9UTC2_EUPED|nr:unnamed protein product [Euphydryas editha]